MRAILLTVGFLVLRPDDLMIVVGIVSWLWFLVRWPVQRIRRRGQRARIVERWSEEFRRSLARGLE